MPLTRDFRDTVMARASRDAAFRVGLYKEGVQAMVDGDLATCRVIMRDFINATVGFAELARRMGTTDKSLMRMLGPQGNPRASNLLSLVAELREEAGSRIMVETRRLRRPAAVAGRLGRTELTPKKASSDALATQP